jgi:hypothetical protein
LTGDGTVRRGIQGGSGIRGGKRVRQNPALNVNGEAAVARRRKEAAERALAEAEARRRDRQEKQLPKEAGKREGPEPTRYGDWEKKGIASDF